MEQVKVQVNQEIKGNINKFPILFSLLIGAFVGMFSEMSLNVALSSLMKEFAISAALVQWLTTGYMLIISILVPISALLLQKFTTRKLFMTAQILFTIGTFLAAISTEFSILLVARLLQAVGTGILIPLMFNTVLLITEPEKRGSIMGIVGLVVLFAPAIAPTAAGLIIQYMNWHWLFWLLIPVLLFDLGYGYVFMKNVSEVRNPKIDGLSVCLSTIGFGGIVYGFSSAGESVNGWSNPVTMISLLLGFGMLLFFVGRQLKMNDPMMNLRVFKYPMFSLGVIIVMLSMLIIFSFLFLTPLYLQNGLVATASITGLVMLPGGLLNGILSPFVGRLFDELGPKWLVIPGMIILSITLFFFSGISTQTTLGTIVLLHCSLMLGISMVLMPAQTNGLNQLPRKLYPHGTAIMNTLQQLAGAIGTALCVTIMSVGQRNYIEKLSHSVTAVDTTNAFIVGVQNGFFFTAILAVIGLIFALFIQRAHQERQN